MMERAEYLFKTSLNIQQLNRRLEKAVGLSLVQWHVLRRVLELPGSAAGVLAKEIGVHPGTLTPLLKRLQGKGYLFLEPDALDARKKTILISREGKTKLLTAEKKFFVIIDECNETKHLFL